MKSLIPTGLALMCLGVLSLPFTGSLWLVLGGFALVTVGVIAEIESA